MSAEPVATPEIGSVFERFAQTLPAYDRFAGQHKDVPSYHGVRVHGKELCLAAADMGDTTALSNFVVLAVSEGALLGTVSCNLELGTVTLRAEPGSCEAGPHTLSLDHATATVTTAEGCVRNVNDFRCWLLSALAAAFSRIASKD